MKIACPQCQKKLVIKNPELLGKQVKCPACNVPFRLPNKLSSQKQAASGLESNINKHNDSEKKPTSGNNLQDSQIPDQTNDPLDKLARIETDYLENRHLKNRFRKKKSGKGFLWVSLAVGMILLSAGGYYFYQQGNSVPENQADFKKQSAQGNHDKKPLKTEKNESESVALANHDKNQEQPEDEIKPVPIKMNHLPDGIRFMIYLKPDEILNLPWNKRDSFKPVFEWGKQKIEQQTGIPVHLMKSILIGFIPRSNDNFPHVVFQIELLPDLSDSKILNSLSVETFQDLVSNSTGSAGAKIYRYNSKNRTLVLFSNELFLEITEGLSLNSFVSSGIEKLLEVTDEKNQFMVLWDLVSMRSLIGSMENPDLIKFMEVLSDWHGEETEAGLWDLSYRKRFRIRSAVRNRSTVNEKKFKKEHEEKLKKLVELFTSNPNLLKKLPESNGLILDRFPAMVQYIAMEAKVNSTPRLLMTQVTLPENAFGNLMIGSLLFWNSHQLKSGDEKSIVPAKEETEIKSLAELLEIKVDLEFRRAPLRKAFEEIAQSIGVELKINGNALKELGYTQNMPQTMMFEQKSAKVVFEKILKQYEGMVLILEEEKRSLLISTVQEAEKQQKKIYLGGQK